MSLVESAMTARVLIVNASRDRQLRAIAAALTDQLSHDGLTVQLVDATTDAIPAAFDYDAIAIGSCVQYGRHPRSIVDYIARSREARPVFLFSIRTRGEVIHPELRLAGTAVFERTATDHRRFLHRLGGHVRSREELAHAEAERVQAFARRIGGEVRSRRPLASTASR